MPTDASLAKLFAIDYALGKVDLEDIVEVNQEVLELVPAGSSLANLYAGEYTVKQIMEAMLVPSGNDAAYVLAYHIAKNELGEGYTATEYIDYFMTELSEYLIIVLIADCTALYLPSFECAAKKVIKYAFPSFSYRTTMA